MNVSREQYEAWLELAEKTVYRVVSPSARNNVTDFVASQAVLEVVEKLEAGEEVKNPEGLVVTVARRRALNPRKAWARRRHLRLDDRPGSDLSDLYFSELSSQLADYLLEGRSTADLLADAVEVIDQAAKDDVDREIGRMHFIENREVEEVARALDLAPRTVQNRLGELKARIRRDLLGED